MATKDRPTLAGEKFKTRKRDERTKFDPTSFSEQLISGINETDGSVEEIAKYLDTTGSQLDYRRYAEPLFDVLIAGGILAPGGKTLSAVRAVACVFTCEPMVEAIRGQVQIFVKLALQRFKYLQKPLEEEMLKILKFLKAFNDDERRALAIFTALCISESVFPVSVITSLITTEVSVKDGLSLGFATVLFQTWIKERGIAHISSSLKKKGLQGRLLELMPSTRRSVDHFDDHFTKEGLDDLVKYRRNQESSTSRKKLQEEVNEVLARDEDIKTMVDDVIKCCQEYQQSKSLTDSEISVMLWKCIMNSADLGRREDLAVDLALKHLKGACPTFLPFCDQGTPQLTLLLKIQEYCHDNAYLTNAFYRIVYLFYSKDVVTEQAIMKWYNDACSAKGKDVFRGQMKRIVDWLQSADEEESDSEAMQTDS